MKLSTEKQDGRKYSLWEGNPEAGELRTFRIDGADNIKGAEVHIFAPSHTRERSVGDAKRKMTRELSDDCRKITPEFLATSVSKQILALYSRAEKGSE